MEETPQEPRARQRPRQRAAAGRPKAGGTVVEFSAPAGRKPKVAVTGGAGFLGSRLVRALAARGDREVVVLDLAPAQNAPAEVRHRFLDLNLPHSDGTVYKLLQEEKPDLLVHLAALRSPSRDFTYVHELNSLGALNVLAAAGESGVPRIIVGGTTMVYGARGDNPAYLSESHPLRADVQDRFVLDFVEAEKHARSHQRNYPSSRVVVLRFAQVLGPDIRDYKTRFLEAPAAITMLGYDPVLQFLHPDDATSALVKAVYAEDARGAFNIAPNGVVPLSSALMLYGTLPIPVPHPLAYAVTEALWLAGLGVAPGAHAHYLRYSFIAGNEKARATFGWEPQWTTLETLVDTARTRRGEGRALDFDALADVARRAAYHLDQGLRGAPAPAGQTGDPHPKGGRESGPRKVAV